MHADKIEVMHAERHAHRTLAREFDAGITADATIAGQRRVDVFEHEHVAVVDEAR